MMRRTVFFSLCALAAQTACADHHAPEPKEAVKSAASKASADDERSDVSVYFISPQDGDVVTSPVKVVFGLKGMGVAPAGANVKNTGHHHLLIDVEELPDMTAPLPATENIVHFGGGQTETSVTLPPGKHSLQLLLGNYIHVPHSPPVMSRQILITVE